MNRKSFLTMLLFACTLHLWAQQIETEQPTIDLGQVLFKSPAIADFTLKNKTGEKIKILQVRTSCGCTTVSYPNNLIASGQSFKISASYDAKTMGHFEKKIGIYTDQSDTPVMLTLRGVVVDEVIDYSGDYPFVIDKLRTDMNNIEFDDVNTGEQPVQKIHIMNTSDKTLQPVLMHLPNYLSGQISPSSIAPGKSGVALVKLNSELVDDLGLTQTTIYLGMYPGDKVSQDKSITVSAVLLPNFDSLDAQALELAPRLKLSTTSVNLGALTGKKKKKTEILLENTGKEPLHISNLQMFTQGLQVSLSTRSIQPGQTAKLRITADVKELKETRSQPRVLMITNDPSQPKIIINILTDVAN